MMHRILIVGETLVLSLALLSPMCASSANALPPNWVLRGSTAMPILRTSETIRCNFPARSKTMALGPQCR